MAIEKTYSMIKPDGVRNGHIGEIIARFERAGLTIERMEMGMVTPEQAAANYAEHEGKPFYDGLISYITSGPVVKMVVSGEGAVKKCRSLMGATNPAEAAPGTIRGDFGLIMDENVSVYFTSPGVMLGLVVCRRAVKISCCVLVWIQELRSMVKFMFTIAHR